MNNKETEYIIAIDPGISGGIVVFNKDKDLLLYQKNPVKKVKNKSSYDIQAFYDIFITYPNSEIVSEFVHSMPNEGSTSSFNFGRSAGLIEGLGCGLQIPFTTITPQKWKKFYAEDLINDEMIQLKLEAKEMNAYIKTIASDTTLTKKEKSVKTKEKTKEKNRFNYQYKKIAKTLSRENAIRKYPKTEPMLKKSTYDGVADALLIGLYYINNS